MSDRSFLGRWAEGSPWPGVAVQGEVTSGDRDFFAVDAVAGQLFLIKINSRPIFPRQRFFTYRRERSRTGKPSR